MASTRFDRRRLLQGAAGGLAIPALGTTLAPRRAAAQAVELEFWTPANDPVGSKIITDLAEGFNSTVGQEQGIHVNTRIKPAPGDDYTQYTTAMTSSGSPDVVMTYHLLPGDLLGRQRLHPAARRVRDGGGNQGGGLLPDRLGHDQLCRSHLGPAAGVRLSSALVEQGDPRRRATQDHRRARCHGQGVHDLRRRRQPDAGGLHPLDAR